MKIRCAIPISLTIYYQTKPDIPLEWKFKTRSGFIFNTQIIGETHRVNRRKYRVLPPFYFKVSSIGYETEVKYSPITKKKLREWAELFLEAHNKAISLFRTCAEVKHVHILNLTEEDYLYQLESWNLEYKSNRAIAYKKFSRKRGGSLSELTRLFRNSLYSSTDDYKMKLAIESLEDGLEIDEESELNLRSLEYLDKKDIRSALLESTFCLEVVIAKYFRQYLKLYKKDISRESIDDFLNPSETLKGRVGVILKLMIHESYLKNINMTDVFEVISIRNKIVHKGMLDVYEKMSKPEDKIYQVILLNNALMRAKTQIEFNKDSKGISEGFFKKFNSYPSIWIYKSHRVSVEITLYYGDKEDASTLKEMAESVASIRSSQDTRFNKSEHLVIRYKKFSGKKPFALWTGGKLITTGLGTST